jgi:hypothetical protein
MTKIEKLLREIRRRDGMTFVECQRFLVDMKLGKGAYDRDWEYGEEKVCEKNPDGSFKLTPRDKHGFQQRIIRYTRPRRWRRYRGYYSGALCGRKCYDGTRRPKSAGPGSVLDKWCVLGEDRRYRIRKGAVLKPPFYQSRWPRG